MSEATIAAKIIQQAIKDWKQPGRQAELRLFFAGTWFEALCELLNIEPDAIRRQCPGLEK